MAMAKVKEVEQDAHGLDASHGAVLLGAQVGHQLEKLGWEELEGHGGRET